MSVELDMTTEGRRRLESLLSGKQSKIKTNSVPNEGEHDKKVENAGIEPATLSMLRTRAANCANSPSQFLKHCANFGNHISVIIIYRNRYEHVFIPDF